MASSGTQDPCLSARVDPNADICYCEAKHVQSFYASIARDENRDFASYDERVLILDEVDALVIDEEPNEAFVYANKELSDMATAIAKQLATGATFEAVLENFGRGSHPAAPRVVREMCKEWARGAEMQAGEDFVFAKEVGKYCKLRGGRVDTKAWSLGLECRNFQDELSREILFQERLFVMSRPRVFKKYHKILGLSGSIGSQAERRFLKETYKAGFFKVPPFLKTCSGSPFHEPVPVRLGELSQAIYLEPTFQAQLARVAEIALEARERVPVLVIAKDRAHADAIVGHLHQAARSRGLGGATEDVIRPLSRALYETDPETWKENLNRATLPLGTKGRGGKSWRVTVTDPRGGRGTDYRVDDPGVDSLGGLLLIPTIVPTSQRDWIQFLGRTARQDRRGQYCAVLCAESYEALAAKYKQPLARNAGIELVDTILSWGDREVAERIRASAALYNTGVRVNEFCEEIFGRKPELLNNQAARESLVEVCQKFRWMSVREVDEAFGRVSGIIPASVWTEAHDLGRPEEPTVAPLATPTREFARPQQIGVNGQPKVVVFCLDRSPSMLSNDCGNGLTRFGTCVKCVQQVLRQQVRDHDIVSIVGFGSRVETVVAPIQKATAGPRLEIKLAGLKCDMAGGTCFFDAVAGCLQTLSKPGLASPQAPRWVVCLTDGDDVGSRPENSRGQLVNSALSSRMARNLNMVMITVGRLHERNVKVINSWVDQVSKSGGVGLHVSEKDASAISKAFGVVAQDLAAD
eukprot:CAMPEP_0117477808 /NCGR_PEP_ID=MMETSP0784-20121206/11017_1 /TAXON_ID=39447 /ORGANISM="" /LENGTH=751 /DNA_ID=CAMNT_0005272129 /DNA_START=45 /DNA_END=2297 /DNA_ORIENTATION=-